MHSFLLWITFWINAIICLVAVFGDSLVMGNVLPINGTLAIISLIFAIRWTPKK